MAVVQKIDSNIVGTRWVEEASIKTLPGGTPTWAPLDPNSFTDWGGEYINVARAPINPSRQRRKGVLTDLNATGGFNIDFTQTNVQDLMQGFFFATFRKKNELAVADVNTTLDDFQPAAGGDGYVAKDLLFAKDFADTVNNGLHVVTGTPAATTVPVTTNLTTASTQSGTISHVGFEFASGDVDVDGSGGTYPALTSTVKSFLDFGLKVGEWVYVGGDLTAEKFVTGANNTFARVRVIAANRLDFDKTTTTMVNETGTGLTIRLFFGRVLQNEQAASIVRRSYQFERTLGAPNDSNPTQIQAEYIEGCFASECTWDIKQADMVKMDLAYMALNAVDIDGPTALRSAAPALTPALDDTVEGFNTSTDFSKLKLHLHTDGSPNPTALVTFIQDFQITINNNVSVNKAVNNLGGFDVTLGDFEVGGSLTGYFFDTTAKAAVSGNSDVTMDWTIVKNNAGFTFDIPLITLGDGRVNVAKDEAITIPLGMQASTGAKIDSLLNHTALCVFWDFLPTAAGA